MDLLKRDCGTSNGFKMPLAEMKNPLVVVVGPTAVGKTSFAITLAEMVKGEIISCDSRLFYRGMDIGTAKPTFQERQRVIHHLIDVTEPDQPWSLALFQEEVHHLIEEIHLRRLIPILVGGTGQYIRAVIEEWRLPPQPPDDSIRRALQSWVDKIGYLELHARLSVIDPEAANSIEPTNVRRTIRALEVILLTGRKFSEQRTRTASKYDLFQIGLTKPRDQLYQCIDERIDKMISNGFVDEVRSLMDKGFSQDLSALSAIGYRQIHQHLAGEISLDEAIICIRRASRELVRRQANWFKLSDPMIHWYDMQEDAMEKVIQDLNDPSKWQKGGKI